MKEMERERVRVRERALIYLVAGIPLLKMIRLPRLAWTFGVAASILPCATSSSMPAVTSVCTNDRS